MKRVPSGIIGLDKLIGGGFPENRTTLISGACGTGKTIFCTQFIYNGALKYKEPGIYITTEERPELIREDSKGFGWDIAKLEEKHLIRMVDGSIAKMGVPSEESPLMMPEEFDLEKLLLEIMRNIKQVGAKRLVIDSLPALGLNFENENETRKAIMKLSYLLQRAGVTSLLTSEAPEGTNFFGRFGVEEYVSDGVIVLHYMGLSTQSNRTLHIRKMRGSKHSEDLHPLKIGKNGITVHKIEEEYKKT